jgi:hypothetical protein
LEQVIFDPETNPKQPEGKAWSGIIVTLNKAKVERQF